LLVKAFDLKAISPSNRLFVMNCITDGKMQLIANFLNDCNLNTDEIATEGSASGASVPNQAHAQMLDQLFEEDGEPLGSASGASVPNQAHAQMLDQLFEEDGEPLGSASGASVPNQAHAQMLDQLFEEDGEPLGSASGASVPNQAHAQMLDQLFDDKEMVTENRLHRLTIQDESSEEEDDDDENDDDENDDDENDDDSSNTDDDDNDYKNEESDDTDDSDYKNEESDDTDDSDYNNEESDDTDDNNEESDTETDNEESDIESDDMVVDNMHMSMVCTRVFETEDVMRKIMDYMSPPEIAGLRYVSKYLDVLGKKVYDTRIEQNTKKIEALWNQLLEDRPSFDRGEKHKSVLTKQLMEYVDQVYKIDWTIFVHNNDFAHKIFTLCAKLHVYRQNFALWRDNYINQKNYDKVYDQIRPYLYLDSPKTYTVDELRHYAVFKKVPRAGRRTRSELIACLRRPSNKLYFNHDVNV